MEQSQGITMPLDFKIACVIYHLKPEKVLQTFINHVSFFMSLSTDYLRGFREATNTLAEFSFENINYSASPAENRDFTIKCVRNVIEISKRNGISAEKKRKKCIPIVRQLNLSLNHQITKPKFYLDENTVLELCDDFRIRCEMLQHTPKEFLEYFMSKISLADRDARIALNKINENPALAFFELVTLGLGRNEDTTIVNGEAQQDFIDEYQTIKYELFIVRDLEEHRALMKQFYLKHYQELIKAI
ncbi:hypothetical protein BEL04_08015 [Mucilaginibacter sp. PPCGB 2223]|uniref:hypothetical protein n=1 Tax=Mucilaginibacter sp. PPCGB 2223 TaxID=1886027 RepID=UPI000824211F|nr:hypothetical protein [Mucilaginibacter sp. PPCGB 2223]OCX54197.1 hypothetical protein BEL04_08015 [Mucilaginibacter sp. PPCGB 2223]